MAKDKKELKKEDEDKEYLEYLKKNNRELREKNNEWELAIEEANKKYGGSKYVGSQLEDMNMRVWFMNFFIFIGLIISVIALVHFWDSNDSVIVNYSGNLDYYSVSSHISTLDIIQKNCGTTHIVKRYKDTEYSVFVVGKEMCEKYGNDEYTCYIPLNDCITGAND